jgi:peroxiredoxin
MQRSKLFLLFLGLILVFPVYGQETDYSKFGIDISDGHIPSGLTPGDKAPAFAGYDQAGTQTELKNLIVKGPVVLFFYRGKWSAECSRYLNNLQDSVNIISDLGATLVAITPESIENVEQTVKFHNITFRVIYDCMEKIMEDYGLMYNVTKAYQEKIKTTLSIDIATNNGREAAHLPVTATYIISTYGMITAAYVEPDFSKRASVNWIIKNLASAL